MFGQTQRPPRFASAVDPSSCCSTSCSTSRWAFRPSNRHHSTQVTAALPARRSTSVDYPPPAAPYQPQPSQSQKRLPPLDYLPPRRRSRPGFNGFEEDRGYGSNGNGGAQGNSNWLLMDMPNYDRFQDDFLPPEPKVQEPRYVNGRRMLCNNEIKAPQVRLQDTNKDDLGVIATPEALRFAEEEGIDLLLISPDADPPVARLVQFSKYKYELEKSTKQKQKASKGVDTKEVRIRPVTETHDYQVMLKRAAGFLTKGNKVKLSMSFSGRELRFKDQGKALMLKFIEDIAGSGKVDGPMNFKSSTYTVLLAPGK